MAVTSRGTKPPAATAILFAASSTNIAQPTTELSDSGYALQSRPGSANYNWLFNYLSAGITHEFIYGIAEFDPNETYVEESYTNRLGLIYRSRQGSNSGNTPESSPTFWHDIRTPLEFTISSSGTHNPQSLFHETLILDASLGGFTVVIGDGAFDKQQVTVISDPDSTALCYIRDSSGTGAKGIYDGASNLGTPISPGYSSPIYTWSSTLGKWYGPDTLTAKWVSGSFTIEQTSTGKLSCEVSFSGTANSIISAYFGTTSGDTFYYQVGDTPFPIAFSNLETFNFANYTIQTRTANLSPNTLSTGTTNIYAGNSIGQTVQIYVNYLGDY